MTHTHTDLLCKIHFEQENIEPFLCFGLNFHCKYSKKVVKTIKLFATQAAQMHIDSENVFIGTDCFVRKSD